MSVPRISAVVWDFDNTLVRQIDAFHETTEKACRALDIPYNKEMVTAALKTNCVFDKLFEHIFTADVAPGMLIKYREIASTVPYAPCEKGHEVVSLFQERKIVQIILTNRDNAVSKRLDDAGYPPAFQRVISPKVKKPLPDAYKEVLESLEGIPKEEILSIGDHLDDYKAARGAGIIFCAVTTGNCTEAEFVEAGLAKERVFSHLGELLDWYTRVI